MTEKQTVTTRTISWRSAPLASGKSARARNLRSDTQSQSDELLDGYARLLVWKKGNDL